MRGSVFFTQEFQEINVEGMKELENSQFFNT